MDFARFEFSGSYTLLRGATTYLCALACSQSCIDDPVANQLLITTTIRVDAGYTLYRISVAGTSSIVTIIRRWLPY